jgi:two-component system chemotaxis sensor kinase CheA
MDATNPAATFLQEAEDLLEQIEHIILELQPGAAAGEAIHQLFRAFHTIKGSGAMFGFDAVAGFTHHVESLLDKVRDGAVPVSPELIKLILASKDQIGDLLEGARRGQPVRSDGVGKLTASLNRLLPAASAPAQTQAAPAVLPRADAGSSPLPVHTYCIHFRPHAGLMASGADPLMLLEELCSLGNCTVRAITDAIPGLEQLQPDQCYLAWDITLETDEPLEAIKDVFIFVEEGSKIVIEPLPAVANNPSPEPAVSSVDRLKESIPGPTRSELVENATKPAAHEGRTAEIRKAAPKDATVRVPSERLDRLVTLVGEMVMNQSRLSRVAAATDQPSLSASVEELERLVAELRDNVLSIRMMPIGTTFGRYKRLVHDLSAELGKEIELVTEGAETELDKTVLDQLADPLVHLVRNSIDHGIEPAEERAKAGKPRRGTIRLAATHIGAHVVLSVADDGGGLNVKAIRDAALRKNLISSDATLSQGEIFNLVFLPGFSTAKRVTQVSGRGVGMDVVKRQIDALRGSIQLTSAAGHGTTVSLTLPLTLAIIDGLLVEIGHDQFIIPMAAVSENVELTRPERQRNNGRNVVIVRGELVPYLRLRDLFEIRGGEPELEKVVIVRFNDQRLGLVVDRVAGSHQTVIQSLSRFCRGVELFSGTTIMGDGRVAMILDLAGLVRQANRQTPGRAPAEHV